MIAVDTNVLARLLARDDAEQTARADRLVRAGPVFVSGEVLIELSWVLGRRYRWPRDRVNTGLRGVIATRSVRVGDIDGIEWALDRHAEGADLSDMLLIVAARGCAAFATFDRAIADDAGADAPVPIETL